MDCLREDKSTCLPTGDPNYRITHSGLDAQVCWELQVTDNPDSIKVLDRLQWRQSRQHVLLGQAFTSTSYYAAHCCSFFDGAVQINRYMDEMATFINLPDALA